ncbi:Aqualysin-1 precursor [Vibrio aerogenes CECT 7868]|uniref:Aqualysin-1 n=1 Tax=Vibrio aerogenes CECT 7868 TaxID=1216006 RepID=A0A1M5Y325_9VIBR|nr:M6 family metalloprotease domain-containing protein [Vibrio aerogenes]SHI06208.1 Aqualysin-1 precursor [Vibrio aerogenes CECT 7868]
MKIKAGKLLIGVGFGILCHTSQAAIPFHNTTYQYTQPNGDEITLTLDGNNYYAEQRTENGRLVIYDEQLKGMAYARVADDGSQLESTGKLVTRTSIQTFANTAAKSKPEAGLARGAKAKLAKEMHDRLMHIETSEADQKMRAAKARTTKPAPAQHVKLSGSMKGLTVLIQFPDDKGTISIDQVNRFLNDLNYHEFGNFQSIRGYWRSVSGGKLDYTNEVTPYYTAKHNKSYYTDTSVQFGVRAQELIHEALNWLEQQRGYDFSRLTTNGNREIRGLNFFYAGKADSPWSKGLWPHMGGVNPRFCADGVCTNAMQMSDMGSELAIGTFAHESGHLIADWPDLYDYDGSSAGSVAAFGLMGYGAVGTNSGHRPVPPVAPLRDLVGWETVTELNPDVNSGAPSGRLSNTSGDNKVYKWSNPKNTSEAFYIETIHQSGQNTYQPDSGLAIWHVDPSGNNSDEWHPYIQMEHADGKRDPENNRNGGDDKDLYDQYGEFTATLPNALTSKGTNSLWWNGSQSGLSITDVSQPAQTVSFTVPASKTVGYYHGSIKQGETKIEPNDKFFNYKGGTIDIWLDGPKGTDFNMTLFKFDWNKDDWVKVAASTYSGSEEFIRYQADEAYYYVEVSAKTGSGNYELIIRK